MRSLCYETKRNADVCGMKSFSRLSKMVMSLGMRMFIVDDLEFTCKQMQPAVSHRVIV